MGAQNIKGSSPRGLEPPTYGLEIRCSVLLSYGDNIIAGEGTRTLDIHLGRVELYQLSYSRTNEQFGAVGFEPATRCFEGSRSIR